MNTHAYLIVSLMLFLLSACTSQDANPTLFPPTATTLPEPTAVPTPTAVSTLSSMQDGGQVYGDPQGRFTFPLPLNGEWAAVESESTYEHLKLSDPDLNVFVVTTKSDLLKEGVKKALKEVGVDTSVLSQVGNDFFAPWLIQVYAQEDGPAIGAVARELDDMTVVIIFAGDLAVLSSLQVPVMTTLEGFAALPLEEYLEYKPPLPTTVEEIEDLGSVEFYNGVTKLVGRLTLPEGEGPFPAIVYTGGGSGMTERHQYDPYFMRRNGFAVLSYDKRGSGDSEGTFVPVGLETSEWRLSWLADDALAAVTFLKGLEEINPNQIGLMGESQNGWTIPLAAARSTTPAFTVIVAGPTVSMGEELYWSEITKGKDPITLSEREELTADMADYGGPRGFDPRPSMEAMSMPGLWIFGDRDGSIPARESKAILEDIIEEYDKDFAIIYDPNTGHGVSENRSEVVDWIYDQLEE